MLPLRTKLAIYYIGFFTLALIALDVGSYLLVRQALLNSVDNEIRLGAQALQTGFVASNSNVLVFFKDGRWRFQLTGPQVSNFDATSLQVQAYDRQGNPLVELENGQASNPTPAQFQDALNGAMNWETLDTDRGPVRQVVQPLLFRDQAVGVLQVTRSMRDTNHALTLLIYVLFGGGVIVVLAASRGGTWLTRAAFKPIDEISRTAQSIVGAEDLSRRVPVPAAQDELHRLTVTINDLLGRLDALFSAQRRFVADVSHELRTPLAAMQGNLEILERGAVNDPQMRDESLADMRREVNRLIRMVNDLLLLVRSEVGLQLRHEPVELDTLLLEVHRELRPLADGVQLRIGEEDQVTVVGDRDRIKQALLNLGINAIQHTPPAGTVTLNLSADPAGSYACLSVTDTGVGIPPEEQPLIFDRFYRVDKARSGGGAGLGLAIVKWIAEVHGGNVSITSALGRGSTFTLHLPMHSEPTEKALLFVHERQIAG